MMLHRIRCLWIKLLVFSGISLLFSCENNPKWVLIVGGGNASAKFGDSTITFRDTLISNNLSSYAYGNGSLSSVNQLSISSSFPSPSDLQFGFSIFVHKGFVGNYPLNQTSYLGSNGGGVSGINDKHVNYTYITDSTHTGEFTIVSYNPQLEIISGTFQFTAVRDSSGHKFKSDTIVVSNGNFVVNLHYYIQQ